MTLVILNLKNEAWLDRKCGNAFALLYAETYK